MSEQNRFYPESRKPDPPPRPQGFLPDESAETGNPGDLGGGYNDLNAGRLRPQEPANPYVLDEETKRIGREGVRKAKDVLRNINPENRPPD